MRRTAVVAAAVVLFAAAVAFAAGSVQQDFLAYWTAGQARRLGLDPYVNHLGSAAAPTLWDGSSFRHSRFLYPPLAAEAFRALAVLPFGVAKALFTAGALAALAIAIVLGVDGRAAGTGGVGRRRALITAALFFPTYLHLDRGQIDLYLLPLLLGAWRARDTPWLAGGLLAATASFKPAVLGIVPVVSALGRLRLSAATLAWVLGLSGVSVVVAGPALTGRYVREVLPRAARYGEGGTESMLSVARQREPDRLRLGDENDDDLVLVGGRGYDESLLERILPFELHTSASLPRLLAAGFPSRASTTAPYLVLMTALVGGARALRRRRRGSYGETDDAREQLLYVGSMIACVVASPVGWAMGLVWALPLAPLATRLRAGGALPPGVSRAIAAAMVAAALPAPVAGLPAVAGAALVMSAIAAAISADGLGAGSPVMG